MPRSPLLSTLRSSPRSPLSVSSCLAGFLATGIATGLAMAAATAGPEAARDLSRATDAARVSPSPSVVSFDPARFAALAPGASLPAEFDALGGRGLRMVARTSVADAEHFVFVHPLQPAREASLLLREGRLVGSIALGGDLRTVVHSARAGFSRVEVADAARELPCGNTDELRAPTSEGGVSGSAAAGCDDGSRVDVLVAYTDAAVAQAGGETQLGDAILFAVADSNAIYAASGIGLTMRLAGTMRVSGYLENASMTNDIYALQDPADGLLDQVLVERDRIGADLVSLLRADGGGACGVGFLVGGSIADAAYGVSVTALGCVTNKTFTHELGHNMGCCHAPGDGGGCTTGGVFLYSTGHRFTGVGGAQYRTVMAYAPGTRIGRFSSPLVLFDGTPTGIADERDNARSINETRFNVTNFRCTPCPGDFDGNREINGADLAFLLGNWGASSASADIDGDGSSDAADLAILLGGWGACR